MDLRPLLLSLIKVQYTRLYFKTIHIIPGEAFVAELVDLSKTMRPINLKLVAYEGGTSCLSILYAKFLKKYLLNSPHF